MQHPIYLQTDKGKEFIGGEVQQLLKKKNIIYRTVRDPDVKAAVVERFIRTLKGRLWRYFTHAYTRRYIDVLDAILEAYNNSWHSGIRMIPAKVTLYNTSKARQNLRRRYCVQDSRLPKYCIGDLVRVRRAKKAFGKAYEGGWTLELFKIFRIDSSRQPIVYFVEDLSGEKIDRFFYGEQLSRVRKNLTEDTFEIEKILQSKGRGAKKQYFVSWKGYPEKFNSWIRAKDLESLQCFT